MAQNDIIDISENASYSMLEASVLLGVTDRQVRRYVNKGMLKSAGAGRVSRASVDAMAGKNTPALMGHGDKSNTITVPRSYLEDLAYRARGADETKATMLLLEHHSAEEAEKKAALERQVAQFTEELAEVRAQLEKERKRPFWRRKLW